MKSFIMAKHYKLKKWYNYSIGGIDLETSIDEKESMNIKVSEAAKILGKSEQFVRIGLQRDILPIGIAIQMSSKWTYHISPKLLKDYVGGEVSI